MRPKTSSLGRNSHVYLVHILRFSQLSLAGTGFRKERQPTRGTTRSSQEQARSSCQQSSGVLLMAVSLSRPRPCLPVLWGALRSFGAFWSIWDVRSMEGLGHGRSSTGYAKEEGRSHLEDQLDQPVEFLNSTGQASTRSS
ncbi:unnamed protein product [Microthlaspi erraticum]|uniref:Uncharacterized protein n=1 Tax=Microthlaspi erraticum TaxID=1685480 RepID=A0A6D2JNR8_9BRAS|nr:unnamed protein product [Microthlaspi erraticum]